MPNFIRLILAVLICEGVGIIGSFFTVQSIPTWYAGLNKPFFSPPNFIFGPVWVLLYLLMGISLYLIWEVRDPKKRALKKMGLQFFFAQLFFNLVWSVVFFGLQSPLLAFIVILILWGLIYKTIQVSQKLNKTAAALLYPYLAWVSFAAILNLAIVILNP